VRVVLLGTAAGGGFPQWNCWCPACRAARSDPSLARPRRQSSAAVSGDGHHWFLLNASPDVREQLAQLGGPTPTAVRHLPIEAVLLTDAELDHTLGIVLLREAGRLPVYATRSVRSVLECDSRLLPVTRAFADVPVCELPLGGSMRLCHGDGSPSGLTVEACPVAGGAPRFASTDVQGHTVGLIVRDEHRGTACAFFPGCGDLDARLLARLATVDVLLFDGTFWTDEELIALGIGTRAAREMDHIPVSGAGGSLEQLAALPCRHRIYTHINNTNPMLLESGPERARVEAAGLRVGFDGLQIDV
jgi:pyrroloquinoline quinone biosynthesis protein B